MPRLLEAIKAVGTKNLLRIDAIKPQLAFLQRYQGHLVALQAGAAASPAERQHWLCFGGLVLFIPLVLVMKGRWSPHGARQDERDHEEMVAAELARLHQAASLGTKAAPTPPA